MMMLCKFEQVSRKGFHRPQPEKIVPFPYMDRLITSSISLELDRISQEEYHIPPLSLMENAALHLFQEIEKDLDRYSNVLFVAGCGNNGGDAIATARIAWCSGFRNISIYYAEGRESELRQVQRISAEALGIPVSESIAGDLVIDGLYGAGLKGEVREEGRALIEKINSLSAYVVAIDVPSGISDRTSSDAVVKADRTITFGYAKSACYVYPRKAMSGRITVVNPSFAPVEISPSAFILSSDDYCVPSFRSSDYKNTRGHIAIFGGSAEYTGAVRLASKSAFKAGAGLVTVFTDPDIRDLVAADSPSAIVRTYSDDFKASMYSAILVGPGMGKGREHLLEELLASYEGPMVVDADGITAFASIWKPGMCIKASLIFTPHPGELRRLLESVVPSYDISTPEGYFSALDTLSNLTGNSLIIAKSDVNMIIRHGEVPLVYDGSNPALGVAGSGDVLAGICAAFSASSIPLYNAVVLHQNAGAAASEEKKLFTSEELTEYVGRMR